jgi:hypothetical protein
MTISMYQASVPLFVRQFEALSAILIKAEEYAATEGIDPATLIEARLAPDMLPLPKQVQIATDMAKGGLARLAGVEVPSYADDETTLADLRARLTKTIAFIQTIPAAQIDGSEARDITLKAGERTLEFKGQPYLLHFVLPNVLFHTTVAYGLLRSKGVPIGKLDFLGPMDV